LTDDFIQKAAEFQDRASALNLWEAIALQVFGSARAKRAVI
jgi:hypothetical protein